MKQKTRKSAMRRFKITGTGKVMRRVSFGRHLRSTKTGRQKRRFHNIKLVTGKVARRVRRLMAIS
jgi:large subunit ribosomal protein L35